MAFPARTRRSTSNNSKRGAPPSAWAFLAVLLLILLGCSPCDGRKLLVAEKQQGEVMHFEGGLVLTVSPSSSEQGAVVPTAPKGFSRAERLMRSVPSPGVGH